MAVISGFFDAQLHDGVPDRKYGADDFGAIFDGIISDGIFEKYPTPESNPFKVTPVTDATLEHLAVQVNPGRAWLNGTWTLNDSTYVIQLPQDRNVNQSRVDYVYIEVNKDDRQNHLVISSGSPMVDSSNVKYHLIAKINVTASENAIDPIVESEIVNMINVDGGTPYVKSNVTDINLTTETIINNLEEQFDSYKQEYGKEFTDWFESIKASIGGLTPDQVIEIAEMVAEAYASDYLSGVYPYVDGTGLYLSSDKTVKPQAIVNFGFVSASMAPNPYANELIVYSEVLTTNGG